MLKTERIKMFTGVLLVASAAFGAACSSSAPIAQTPRVKPVESPTPAYQPPKRVSRDIIKTEAKPETVKVKAK